MSLSLSPSISLQAVYFEVGNLNTESYPAAADLPTYVRENYESGCNHGNENIDRIIISYQVRTRVVEMVYVTEHDGEAFGSFSPDRTHEITSELIQVLQNPQLDLTTFLSQVGYCEATQMVPANNIEVMHPESCGQQIFNTTVRAYSGSTARTAQSDFIRVFSEASYQQLGIRIVPFYSDEQHQNRRPKAIRRPYALRQSYWPSAWEQPDEGKGAVSVCFCLCLTVLCFSTVQLFACEQGLDKTKFVIHICRHEVFNCKM